jgi:hypothetical protein
MKQQAERGMQNRQNGGCRIDGEMTDGEMTKGKTGAEK